MNRTQTLVNFDQRPQPAAGDVLAHAVGLMAGKIAAFLRARLNGDAQSMEPELYFLDQVHAAARQNGAGHHLTGWLLPDPGEMSLSDLFFGEAHPLHRLILGFGLSSLEVDLVLLAGMAEDHEGYADIFRQLHPRGEPRPSMGLAAQLFCSDAPSRDRLRTLLINGPAVTAGILGVPDTAPPFFNRDLVPAEGMWPVLHGIDAPGCPHCRFPGTAPAYGLEHWLQSEDIRAARNALDGRKRCFILVTADDRQTALHRGLAVVASAGLAPMPIEWPEEPRPELEGTLSVQAVALGKVPVVTLAVPQGPQAASAPEFRHFPGPVVVCARTGIGGIGGTRPLVCVRSNRLKAHELRRMWRRILPALGDRADVLAARYPLEPHQAAQIADDLAASASPDGTPPEPDDVAAAIHARAATDLGGGVQLIRPAVQWRHLVLPEAQMGQLHEAVSRLHLQGRVLDDWRFLEGRRGSRGVRMLFFGPPGTGKTLSAEVLAHALKVDLLQVDISRVVSKWIGETEKNLAKVFDAAEAAKAVLLFDEADALFGRRTEVADAHDRYANLETAYLLSRLERFDGMAILSTNLRQNIDSAFMRRLEFIVEYAPPARRERLALWQCHLPDDAPLAEDVNLETLAAHFAIVGGLIRNAAVSAAYMAAAENGPIAMKHFLHAIRREYEKNGLAYREVAGKR